MADTPDPAAEAIRRLLAKALAQTREELPSLEDHCESCAFGGRLGLAVFETLAKETGFSLANGLSPDDATTIASHTFGMAVAVLLRGAEPDVEERRDFARSVVETFAKELFSVAGLGDAQVFSRIPDQDEDDIVLPPGSTQH